MAYELDEIKIYVHESAATSANQNKMIAADITTSFWLLICKVGLGLIGFGLFFSVLGVILFFDRGLLALGNILWLAGVAILLGWRSTWQLFTSRSHYTGSASFILGLFLIFVRWPIVGMLFELYGCVVLFGGFWSSIKVFLFQIPVLGWIIQFLDRMQSSA